jgi:hypothetical protein
MQDNDDNDNGHRTPLRWPPRVGRRQWKPRTGMQPSGQPAVADPGTDQWSRDMRNSGQRDMRSNSQPERGPMAKQPNERDESVEKTGVPEVRTKQRKTIQRAYEDVTSGRVDTDLRGQLHETYGRLRRKPNSSR